MQNKIAKLLLVVLLLPANLLATDISTGYKATEALPSGTLVSVKPTNPEEIEPATPDNINHLLGVVVREAETLLAVSGNGSNTQVSTSGLASVWVSDLAGPIKRGDAITASRLNGIGVKATAEVRILGIAQTNFDTSNSQNIERTETINNPESGAQSINIGRIPVLLQVGKNLQAQTDLAFLPDFLNQTANTIAGESVAPIRILGGLILIILAFLTDIILLYGAVSSAIISLGRNPLSKGSVYRGLVQVALISVAILLTATLASYIIITS